MKRRLFCRLRPVLFTLGGALAGYLYYRLVGCASGACAIASSPVHSTLWLGAIGWLLSQAFGRDCGDAP